MMRPEPREEEPIINIVTRSGASKREDKGKQLETKGWVHKAIKKEV